MSPLKKLICILGGVFVASVLLSALLRECSRSPSLSSASSATIAFDHYSVLGGLDHQTPCAVFRFTNTTSRPIRCEQTCSYEMRSGADWQSVPFPGPYRIRAITHRLEDQETWFLVVDWPPTNGTWRVVLQYRPDKGKVREFVDRQRARLGVGSPVRWVTVYGPEMSRSKMGREFFQPDDGITITGPDVSLTVPFQLLSSEGLPARSK